MAQRALISERYRFRKDGFPEGLSSAQSRARSSFLDEVHAKNRYVGITACPYCGSLDFEIISEVERRGLPADVAVCLSCDGSFKARIMDQGALSYHYNNISYVLRGKDQSRGSMEKLFRERVERFAYPKYYFIRHFIGLDPERDLVAELGCNDGANLFPWKEHGFTVAGIDLDDASASFGRKMGLDIKSGDFMDNAPSDRKPKLVILSHLLEHVSDAKSAIRRVKDILSPSGYLFIESPGIRVHGLSNTLAYFDVEHNYNFDRASLARLLDGAGFDVVYSDEYVRFICIPRGSIETPRAESMRISADAVIAAILKRAMGAFGVGRMKLVNALKEGERGSLRMALYSKLQTQYFKSLYSAIVSSEERC